MNVVNLFSSHRAIEEVRELFMHAVDQMLSREIDIQVIHVPGVQNTTADALSRTQFDRVRLDHPKALISTIPLPAEFARGGIRPRPLHQPSITLP